MSFSTCCLEAPWVEDEILEAFLECDQKDQKTEDNPLSSARGSFSSQVTSPPKSKKKAKSAASPGPTSVSVSLELKVMKSELRVNQLTIAKTKAELVEMGVAIPPTPPSP